MLELLFVFLSDDDIVNSDSSIAPSVPLLIRFVQSFENEFDEMEADAATKINNNSIPELAMNASLHPWKRHFTHIFVAEAYLAVCFLELTKLNVRLDDEIQLVGTVKMGVCKEPEYWFMNIDKHRRNWQRAGKHLLSSNGPRGATEFWKSATNSWWRAFFCVVFTYIWQKCNEILGKNGEKNAAVFWISL